MTAMRLCLLTIAQTATALLVGPSIRLASAPARGGARVVCAETLTDASGAPIKAAMSSYMHFCSERRSGLTQELKAKLGTEFKNTLVMSGLGAEWKTLSDDAKAKFAAAAQADKERYEAAVASNPDNKLVKKTRKKTKRKSSDGPKKLSAYMHFCAERRPAVTAQLKQSMGADFKTPAVMVALGAEWKALGDADKARFQQLAAQPVA